MGRLTLKDVAEACGLSRSAVSLVVQDSPRVSAATKERVRRVMAEMGYVYDRAAANLRTRRSMAIGLIVTNVRNPYFAELAMAIENGLQDMGYTLLVGYSHDEADRQERLMSTMTEYRADGVIILPAAGTTAAGLRRLAGPGGAPHVLIARQVKGHDSDYVGVDNVKAGTLLGEHIRDLGPRTVAFVGGPAESEARAHRHRGVQKALKPAGIELSPKSLYASHSTPDDGARVTRELLDAGPHPDVIVAYSDAVAFGVQHALHDRGLRVGADVALGSFDDTTEARHQVPPLTSVSTFPAEIGEQAARLLLDRIGNGGPTTHTVIVPPALQVRESTSAWSPRAPRRTTRKATRP